MAYRALSDVMLGTQPPAHTGDIIPSTYPDLNGNPQPVDFERLLEHGLAEKVEEPRPRRSKASA